MTTLALAVFALVAFVPIALIIGRDPRRTPPRVPPAHPRRSTINVLQETGDQVDQTVFPNPRP